MGAGATTDGRREYRMVKRAAAAEETRLAILEAAYELFRTSPYDEVTLRAVADRAGVALQTVVRRFGSKDNLILEAGIHYGPREFEDRAVSVGDVDGAVAALARRYEDLGLITRQFLELERRNAAVARLLSDARRGHLAWLERTFAPWLASSRAARRRQLAQLFGATEIYVWLSWRTDLGLSPAAAQAAMADTVRALLASFGPTTTGPGGPTTSRPAERTRGARR